MTINPSADIITTGAAITIGDDDDFIIGQGITVQSTQDIAIRSNASIITGTIAGTVEGTYLGIYFNSFPGNAFNYDITVASTGIVRAVGTALYMGGTEPFTGTGQILVNNAGTIESSDFYTVALFNFATLGLTNSGTISSADTDASWSQTLYLSGADASITNSGTISNVASTTSTLLADLFQVATIASVFGFGKEAGDTTTIINTGLISGGSTAIVSEGGVDTVQNNGRILGDIWLFEDADNVINTNEITGRIDFGTGVFLFDNSGVVTGDITGDADPAGTLVNTFTNNGTINGGQGGIAFTGGGIDFFSDGTINANVALGGGDNILVNAGDLIGSISTQGGADTLSNEGFIQGNVDLGDGDNNFETVLATGSQATRFELLGNLTLGGGNDIVSNESTITGNITLGGGNNDLANIGLITGMIMGGTGADTIINSGAVVGDISTGGGGDQFTNESRATVTGNILFTATGGLFTNDGFITGDVTIQDANVILNNTGILTGAVTISAGPSPRNGSGFDLLPGGTGMVQLLDLGDGLTYRGRADAGDNAAGKTGPTSGSGDTITVTNGGVLGTTTGPVGLSITGSPAALTNTGALNGAVSLSAFDDQFNNSGDVNGTVDTGDGNDTLINSGNITGIIDLGNGLDFYDGSATMLAGATVNGGAGNDRLIGGGEVDDLRGDDGDDILEGGGDNDTLSGGAGNDIIAGGAAGDVLDGGTGIDTLDYSASDAAVQIDLTLATANGGHATGDNIGDPTLGVTFENIIGSDFDDTLTGNGVDNVIIGGLGADAIDGRGGIDTIDFSGAASGVAMSIFNGGFIGEAAGDTYNSIENIIGSNFDDSLRGAFGTSAPVEVYGMDGNDDISLEGADGFLDGGAGNDILRSSADGETMMIGGTGMDTFQITPIFTTPFSTGTQTIADFENDIDTIDLAPLDLSGLGINTVADLLSSSAVTQVGADVVIDLSFGFVYFDLELVIQNTTVADLTDDILL